MTTITAIVKSELEALYADRGRLIPEDVVEAARPAKAPLHAMFEWSDREAGEQFRLLQAAGLIRSVKIRFITPEGDAAQVRRYHSLRSAGDENAAPGYVDIDEIAGDPVRERLLEQMMLREVAAMRRKYQHLTAFWAAIDADRPALDATAAAG